MNSIPLSVEDLTFQDYSQLDSSVLTFNLSPFSHLKSLIVGDNSFGSSIVFVANGLNELISIHIGMNSFTRSRYSYAERMSREFHLRNCESLRELVIGRFSFSDYHVLDLKNLPNLKSIIIGSSSASFNFYYVENVEFMNLPSLESLDFGHSCFHHAHSVRIESMI